MLVEGIAITLWFSVINHVFVFAAYTEGREDSERGAPPQQSTQVVVICSSVLLSCVKPDTSVYAYPEIQSGFLQTDCLSITLQQ